MLKPQQIQRLNDTSELLIGSRNELFQGMQDVRQLHHDINKTLQGQPQQNDTLVVNSLTANNSFNNSTSTATFASNTYQISSQAQPQLLSTPTTAIPPGYMNHLTSKFQAAPSTAIPSGYINHLTTEQQQLLILQVNKLNQTIAFLENEWKTFDRLLADFEYELNEIKQYMRRNSLLIHGLCIPKDGNNKPLKGYAFADYVCEELNKHLSHVLVHKLSSDKHIDAAHVLPTQNKKKPVIIVKFMSKLVRNDILQQTGTQREKHFNI